MKDREFIREMMSVLDLVFNPRELKDECNNVVLTKSQVRRMAMEELASDYNNYIEHRGKIRDILKSCEG